MMSAAAPGPKVSVSLNLGFVGDDASHMLALDERPDGIDSAQTQELWINTALGCNTEYRVNLTMFDAWLTLSLPY